MSTEKNLEEWSKAGDVEHEYAEGRKNCHALIDVHVLKHGSLHDAFILYLLESTPHPEKLETVR